MYKPILSNSALKVWDKSRFYKLILILLILLSTVLYFKFSFCAFYFFCINKWNFLWVSTLILFFHVLPYIDYAFSQPQWLIITVYGTSISYPIFDTGLIDNTVLFTIPAIIYTNASALKSSILTNNTGKSGIYRWTEIASGKY